jgi:hypothetical protein
VSLMADSGRFYLQMAVRRSGNSGFRNFNCIARRDGYGWQDFGYARLSPNGQTIRTIAWAADVRRDRTPPGEWNRCKQRPAETQVSNITHCGIGHVQAPNIARDTFLAVTHVPHLFAA